MGLAVGDYDNDVDLDLSFSDVATHDVYCMSGNDPPQFEDVSAAMGVVYDAHGWGTLFLDYDNDGFLDLYVADSQLPDAHTRMFHNHGGTGFTDAPTRATASMPGWNFGVSQPTTIRTVATTSSSDSAASATRSTATPPRPGSTGWRSSSRAAGRSIAMRSARV